MATDRDSGWIAAKGCNVIPHPAQSSLLIQDTVITPIAISIFTVQMAFRQKAKQAQAIVEGDDHGGGAKRTTGCELGRVVVIGFALNVAAAVKPDYDRFCCALISCRKDVQI